MESNKFVGLWTPVPHLSQQQWVGFAITSVSKCLVSCYFYSIVTPSSVNMILMFELQKADNCFGECPCGYSSDVPMRSENGRQLHP